MAKFKVKFDENFVYEDNISLTCTDVLSCFIWFGHKFYLSGRKKRLFVPAGTDGWKWILDENALDITETALRLTKDTTSKSYIAIHFSKLEPAPYPINFSLHVPEFVGNYFSIIAEDTACRVKNFLTQADEIMHIDQYLIKFTNIKGNNVFFDIQSQTDEASSDN